MNTITVIDIPLQYQTKKAVWPPWLLLFLLLDYDLVCSLIFSFVLFRSVVVTAAVALSRGVICLGLCFCFCC